MLDKVRDVSPQAGAVERLQLVGDEREDNPIVQQLAQSSAIVSDAGSPLLYRQVTKRSGVTVTAPE